MSALVEVHRSEDLRLAALGRYRLLDTPPEEPFDRITRRAAERLKAPFALFSLVDRDRVFIKSRYGLDLEQIERVPRRRHSPLLPGEVLWANEDDAGDCFKSLRDFDAAEMIRFYAAAPLVTYDGFTLGTLSVMAPEPRREDQELKRELGRLAGTLMREIETRRLLRRLETPESESAAAARPSTGDDALTGLATRHQLFDRLGRELELTRRRDPRDAPGSALLVLAVDRFMAINGSLGYECGDRVLRELARRLEHAVPAAAQATRLGGDEFAVLATGLGSDGDGDGDARRLADDLQTRLRWPMRLDGRRVSVSASIGIARLDEGYARPDEVLRDAEIAMSRAKAGGGARHELFDVARHGANVEQLELETELRGALARGELRLHYQPIVELERGTMLGFEALVRWQHPRRGLLRPRDFIALADAVGLMPAITEWTLERACRQLADWQLRFGQPAWTMSVNIDARLLTERTFAARVDRVLRTSGLSPSSLNLEVTETAMMSSSAESSAMLGRLRDRGIALHIDDFGTGYATLSYLHRVPGQALKIDASFITGMTCDQRHHEIVRSIVGLAHKLGLQVIAEGVETPLHLRALRDLGCEHGQGFYFSRPLDPASLEELLAAETPWIEEAVVN